MTNDQADRTSLYSIVLARVLTAQRGSAKAYGAGLCLWRGSCYSGTILLKTQGKGAKVKETPRYKLVWSRKGTLPRRVLSKRGVACWKVRLPSLCWPGRRATKRRHALPLSVEYCSVQPTYKRLLCYTRSGERDRGCTSQF